MKGEQLEDLRNVGESSCNFGDGTEQRVQTLMFMMMMMKGQCEAQPRIDHEGQEREERHSSTLSLTGTDFPHPSRSTKGLTQPPFPGSQVARA